MAPFFFFKLGHPKIVDDLPLKMSKTNVEMSLKPDRKPQSLGDVPFK